MSESELRPLSKLPMMAYYFGFSETGCRAVDEVLSAVACAGKGYHHTEEWSDNKCRDLGFSFPTEGLSYAEVIQKAARVAAERIARLEAQNKALCEALGKIARWEMPRNVYIDGVEMEYGIAYGSQGEKHVIRSIARAAIAQAKEQG